MKESLIRGDRLYQMLALVGFSDNIVTQISLADKHGNLLGSLTKIETYMLRITEGDGKNNWAVQLVQIFPQLFL